MGKQVHPAIIVAIIVVLVAVLGWGIYYYSSPHTPAGVHYTPGVPPWMEKGAKGGYSPYKIPAGAPAPARQSAPPSAPASGGQ